MAYYTVGKRETATGWPLSIEGKRIEGTAVEKADAVRKHLTAVTNGGTLPDDYDKITAQWYHDGKPCNNCADTRLALLYLAAEADKGVSLPDLLLGLLDMGYGFDKGFYIVNLFEEGLTEYEAQKAQ